MKAIEIRKQLTDLKFQNIFIHIVWNDTHIVRSEHGIKPGY